MATKATAVAVTGATCDVGSSSASNALLGTEYSYVNVGITVVPI